MSETNIKQLIDKKYNALNVLITANANKVNLANAKAIEAHSLADHNRKQIETLSERIHVTEDENRKLAADFQKISSELDKQSIQLASTRYRLEDQTNRNCRRTLIVKGVKENQNESWKDTKKLLCVVLFRLTQLDSNTNDISNWIERAHRGRQTKDGSKDGIRDIHVLFFDWNCSQLILSEFIKHGRGQNVFIEQRYGPDTTFRQNKAKEERRSLINDKIIQSGYVKFPATLMVKYSKDDTKYVPHKDFSKIEVTPRRVTQDGFEL